MDRLPALTLALVGLVGVGCKGDTSTSSAKAGRQRVNAVAAKAPAAADVEGMCDRYYKPGAGPTLRWPALADGEPPARSKGWQWINLWATWCKPCVEELPRLRAWQPRLVKAGASVELFLVSADEDEAAVQAFRAEHHATLPTRRLHSSDTAATWVEFLGVKGAALPVHVFVDPSYKVRCVRASAIEESDYPAVEQLLRGG